MTCTVFTGCSYTKGIGLAKESTDTHLWANIFHSAVLSDTNMLNLAKGGASNLEIFHSAIEATLVPDCKYLFVQWTDLFRFRVNPGVELHSTSIYFGAAQQQAVDVNIHPDITYSAEYIDNIKNRFFDLQHNHYEIVKIIKYSNLIKKLCDRVGITVFFINGILPWDDNYFLQVVIPERLPADTTLYTQKQLDATTRDDIEYFMLYDKIHKDYQELAPTKHRWLNLYSSFRRCFYLDRGLDNLHPGVASHYQFAQHLIEIYKDQG